MPRGKAGNAHITHSSARRPERHNRGRPRKSWRKLSEHPSTLPGQSFVPIVKGKRIAVREMAADLVLSQLFLSSRGAMAYRLGRDSIAEGETLLLKLRNVLAGREQHIAKSGDLCLVAHRLAMTWNDDRFVICGGNICCGGPSMLPPVE
jgi:hypothetical protein